MGPVQPANVDTTLDSVADTWMEEQDTSRNNGDDRDLDIEQRSGRDRRPLLRWDLSSIPATATINSASFRFFVNNEESNVTAVDVHRVTQSWVEGTGQDDDCVTGATWDEYDCSNAWSTGGGDFNGTSVGSFVPAPV